MDLTMFGYGCKGQAIEFAKTPSQSEGGKRQEKKQITTKNSAKVSKQILELVFIL